MHSSILTTWGFCQLHQFFASAAPDDFGFAVGSAGGACLFERGLHCFHEPMPVALETVQIRAERALESGDDAVARDSTGARAVRRWDSQEVDERQELLGRWVRR